ncbi:MAG: sigma-70 family RNA polymerase sigma factor [Planctomycetes bacterium]|nr:sigma-70 family RNA polymerase sigma factor [Planctomycetota bacterium]
MLDLWTLIRDAAAGRREARESFSQRYLPVVRAYFQSRWGGTPLASEVDDAVQKVFLDCFRERGALERVDPDRGGFRAFLYGIARNVALHAERARARDRGHRDAAGIDPEGVAADEESVSRAFDKAWARAVMREAVDIQTQRAHERGLDAVQRVELLRLRFQEGLPIREIAKRWGADPARLHHDYAQARKEFTEALKEVVGIHERCPPERLEAECARLLELLR